MSDTAGDGFARSRAHLEVVVGFLSGGEANGLEHSELEDRLTTDGRELMRLLYQDHLDLRATREVRLREVVDANGSSRSTVETDHARLLATIFGEVTVTRLAYRRRGLANLHPVDAVLNLPTERHSHGLSRLAAEEAARGSFDDTTDAICRCTGVVVGKRQAEELAQRAAVDFETFYETRLADHGDPEDILVISADGKGIVMRPDSLRRATAQAARRSHPKLSTRLSKGEQRNRKRMAEVGAVYDLTPVARTPADVLARSSEESPAPAPVARNKWLTASVVEDAATVVSEIFDEAERRDPEHERTWVALVDGNNHQIASIRAEATAREVEVHVVIDFIHVLEYLWSAAWSFYAEGDAGAEAFVHEKALAVLDGKSSTVAGAIRRKATCLGLTTAKRANADRCARYLLNKRGYLDYRTALERGWPIATGVIEGACRHLVKDRMDITGARWGLQGAEAVLKLRALRANGDFPSYWHYHVSQERRRVHLARYLNGAIPRAA